MRRRLRRACALAVLAAHTAHAAPAALPSYRIDIRETSVSGLSSGAYMAVQFAVAHSALVKGVGVIAGGPYFCARGNVFTATTICSCTSKPLFVCQVAPGSTKVEELIRVTDTHAGQRAIDPVTHLGRQRIWMFSGRADSVVPPAVMDDLHGYFRHYIDAGRIRYKKDLAAEHAMPTDGYGNGCGHLGEPYISNCRYDGAGELLQWIYDGALKPRNEGAPAGRFIEFDQREFVADRLPRLHGLADTGFAYVPAACESGPGPACKLHVAFHGCRQNAAFVGDKFIRNAGYNKWADSNRMIVLYPQTTATAGNPKGCWDWFNAERNNPGYATKGGVQVLAIRHMIDRLAGATVPGSGGAQPVCFTTSNFEHVRSGRAHLDFFLWARANGSNASLGFADAFSKSTLKRTGPNHYVTGSCP